MDVYKNQYAESDNRVNNLLSLMTVEEKMQMLHEVAPAIPGLGVAKYDHGNEALHGVARPGKFAVFPQAIGLGATWNIELIKQVITQQGIDWEVGQNPFVGTLVGDTLWTNYEVQADVNILEDTGYAKLLGRVMEARRGGDYPNGYWFKINTSGNWVLYAGDQKIGSGITSFSPFIWHQLSMKFQGNMISVSVNDKEVVSVTDSKYIHGLAEIGSDFNTVEFDNFEIK